MWKACSSGHLIVKLLIEARAKVNKTDMVCSSFLYFTPVLQYVIGLFSINGGLCGKCVAMVTLKLSNY